MRLRQLTHHDSFLSAMWTRHLVEIATKCAPVLFDHFDVLLAHKTAVTTSTCTPSGITGVCARVVRTNYGLTHLLPAACTRELLRFKSYLSCAFWKFEFVTCRKRSCVLPVLKIFV